MNEMFKNPANNLQNFVLLFTRIIVGYMFMMHGTTKLFSFPASMTNGKPAVELFSIMGIGGVLEIVGGILLILGLFVRPVSFLLAGMMAVAYFVFHSGFALIFNPIVNKGEAAALYCMVFLLYWVFGAGKYSLDGKWIKSAK